MKKKLISDDEYNYWDLIIKAISSLLTIATLIIGAFTYLSNQKEALRQKEREFRKDVSVRQISTYAEISEVIGDLLVTLGHPDSLFTNSYITKKDKFLQLYFGKMNLIESVKVDKALQSFYYLLDHYELDDPKVKIEDLRIAAFGVNDTFRKSIEETVGVQVGGITK